ncbi:hypothetical protein FRB99_001342 [Tulasnella sp. 403]|nr:hypothetical protein FRB99_001342 [Tulasnella sp. 403]
MADACPGCGSTFTSIRSFGGHRRRCEALKKKALSATQSLQQLAASPSASPSAQTEIRPSKRQKRTPKDTLVASNGTSSSSMVQAIGLRNFSSPPPSNVNIFDTPLVDPCHQEPRVAIKLRDQFPSGPVGPLQACQTPRTPDSPPGITWETQPNAFNLVRCYSSPPSIIPDIASTMSNAFESGSFHTAPMFLPPLLPKPLSEALGPFPNYSSFLHYSFLWLREGLPFSNEATEQYNKRVLYNPDFDPMQVDSNFRRLKKAVAEFQPNPLSPAEGWKQSTVTINVPLGKPRGGQDHDLSAQFPVPGLYHRSIVDIVRRVLSTDPNVKNFHLHPFRQYIQRPPPATQPTAEPTRSHVIDDIFNSDAMLKEYEDLMASPPEPDCPHERIIVGLQFWSDATLLANFGSAKLWPVYMYFGNQPKHERSRPDLFACHDIAYVPTIEKANIHLLGTAADATVRRTTARKDDEDRKGRVEKARRFIYTQGKGVGSKDVDDILQPHSEVPTQNAFSVRFGPFGFDYHKMLAVDMLHEFEAGDWKAVFTHLLRMLHTVGGTLVHEMDSRYRAIPPFGRDTIRRILSNPSELKRLAARDYEDFLQCAIPVFDDLFPDPHNSQILDFLFTLADWHSLAKLKMHTEETIAQLEMVTQVLGRERRRFGNITAAAFKTYETPSEARARARRQQQAANKMGASVASSAGSAVSTRREKTFNLNTYKAHALGDYASQIWFSSTYEVYSTRQGETRHRHKKRQYAGTNKRDFEKQIGNKTTVAENIRLIDVQVAAAKGTISFAEEKANAVVEDGIVIGPSERRYVVGESSKNFFRFSDFLRHNKGDPSTRHFNAQFLDHVLARLRGQDYSWDDPKMHSTDFRHVDLEKDRIYTHATIQFNYTTYDIRRSQDTVKSRLSFKSDGTVAPTDTRRSAVLLPS